MKTRDELPIRSRQTLDQLEFRLPCHPRREGLRRVLASWVFSVAFFGALVAAWAISQQLMFAFMAMGAGAVLVVASLFLLPVLLTEATSSSYLILGLGRHELQVGSTMFVRSRIEGLWIEDGCIVVRTDDGQTHTSVRLGGLGPGRGPRSASHLPAPAR